MQRRTTYSLPIALLCAITFLMMAAAKKASAQPQDLTCCTYTVDVQIPTGGPCGSSVFPLTLVTDWCPTGQAYFTAPNNGIYMMSVAGSCPPFAPYLLTADLNGGGGTPLGMTGAVTINGCTVTYTVGTDISGCIYITIR